MESEFESAYLLHSRPFQDAGLIVELFSLEQGRLPAVVRSARGKGKRARELTAILQPFQQLEISWRGRTELKTLIGAESGARVPLAGEALFCGFYLNEITLRALHRLDPHPHLWHAYDAALKSLSLSSQGDVREYTLRRYELTLLEVLGYGLDFRRDAVTSDAVVDCGVYRLSDEGGFFRVEHTKPGCFSGGDLLAMADLINSRGALVIPDRALLRELKRVCRLALRPLLGEKPLKSRELFQK